MSAVSPNGVASTLVRALLCVATSSCGGGNSTQSSTGVDSNSPAPPDTPAPAPVSSTQAPPNIPVAYRVPICTAHFVESDTGQVIADWGTAPGCSDSLVRDQRNGAEDDTVYDVAISDQAVLTYATAQYGGGSGTDDLLGLINLRSGHIVNRGSLMSVGAAASDYDPYNGAAQLPSIFHALDTNLPGQTITFDNYGQIGVQNATRSGAAVALDRFTRTSSGITKPAIVLNNFGSIWATNLYQNFSNIAGVNERFAGPTPTLVNHRGGLVATTTGSAANVANVLNYLNAGLVDTVWNWSWCSHGNTALSFENWGYCIAAENAIEWSGSTPGHPELPLPIKLYGGPLVPAARDFNDQLVFNGSVSSNLQYTSQRGALCQGFSGSAPILVDGPNANVALDLYNTVWEYADPNDGTAAFVNYLPLVQGYPIVGDTTQLNHSRPAALRITFHFEGLTAAQQDAVSAAIAAANANPFYAVTTDNTKTAQYGINDYSYSEQVIGASSTMVPKSPWATQYAASVQLGGYAYRWCGVASVHAEYASTKTVQGQLLPQVYFTQHGLQGRQYFRNTLGSHQTTDSADQNPFYLINPSTVQLNAVPGASSPRNIHVGPGWTLVIGGTAIANLDAAPPAFPRPVPNGYPSYTSPIAGTSLAWTTADVLTLETAVATTSDPSRLDPETRAEYEAAGQRRELIGTLVVDDRFRDSSDKVGTITLPALAGAGRVVQEGSGTTVVASANPAFLGDFAIADGKLKIVDSASFDAPPAFVFGNRDGAPIRNSVGKLPVPTLDLSALSGRFVVRALDASGPQAPANWTNCSHCDALTYPLILGPAAESQTLVLQVGQDTAGGATRRNRFAGALTGAIALDIARGNELDLGFASFQHMNSSTHRFEDLSTFTGGVKVQPGASLKVLSRGALGRGDLINAGHVELVQGFLYFPAVGSVKSTPPVGAQWIAAPGLEATKSGLPNELVGNRTLFVQGDYRQTASGSLQLSLRGPDPDLKFGSGAGILYETLAVSGSAHLGGVLRLELHEAYALPPGGLGLPLVFAKGGIDGAFSRVEIADAKSGLIRSGQLLGQAVTQRVNPGTKEVVNIMTVSFK